MSPLSSPHIATEDLTHGHPHTSTLARCGWCGRGTNSTDPQLNQPTCYSRGQKIREPMCSSKCFFFCPVVKTKKNEKYVKPSPRWYVNIIGAAFDNFFLKNWGTMKATWQKHVHIQVDFFEDANGIVQHVSFWKKTSVSCFLSAQMLCLVGSNVCVFTRKNGSTLAHH